MPENSELQFEQADETTELAIVKVQNDIISLVSKLIDDKPLNALQLFQTELNGRPAFVVKERKIETIPISFIEAMLDAYYLGRWSTQNFRWQIVVNEIIGTLDLHVTHPVTGEIRILSGSASIQIMVNAGSDFTDVKNKKPNALEMGFPKLQSQCLCNAAKRLGKRFGRDLNRKKVSVNLEVVKTNELLQSILNENK